MNWNPKLSSKELYTEFDFFQMIFFHVDDSV